MVISGRKLGLLAAAGLLLVALFLASCGSMASNPGTTPTSNPPSVLTTGLSSTTSTDERLTTSSTGVFPFTTSPTTLFPSQLSFMQELSGDGYQAAIVFTEPEGSGRVLTVWVVVEPNEATRATNDVIFDQAVTLAKQYGAADSTGGWLRVELSDAPPGEFIKDYIFESRDFDLSGSEKRPTTTSTGATTPSTTLASLPASPPADFSFVAAYGVTSKNVLDTFAGTFTKDIISPSKPNPTVELRLTAEELATLYQDLVDMDVLDYPSVFQPESENTSGTMVTMEPHQTYLLTIRMTGIEKHISWEDAHQMRTPEAKALRGWFKKLQLMIEAKPEYRAMPPVEGGYL